jgi:hypothetical protein
MVGAAPHAGAVEAQDHRCLGALAGLWGTADGTSAVISASGFKQRTWSGKDSLNLSFFNPLIHDPLPLVEPSFQVKMAVVREVPSNLPQKPSNLPSSDNKGLSVGATVGIGIGIALLVILGALGAWIFVRRRRRTWAQKRKTQGDSEFPGDTPNEEITKRLFEYGKSNGNGVGGHKEMRIDGAVEIGDGELDKAVAQQDNKPPINEKAYEMPTAIEPVEIGGGNHFAAELEGSAVMNTVTSTDKNETCPVNPGIAQR